MIDLLDLTLLSPPFSAEGDAEPEPVTDNFLAALRTRLRSIADLSPIGDIYLTTSPPEAAYPYLVINRLWQSPFINTSSSYYKEVGVQFTLLSQDADEADTLGNAAYDALFPEDANPSLVFTDGYEMTRSPGQSHGPDAQTSGRTSGDPVWMYRFDYTFLIGKG